MRMAGEVALVTGGTRGIGAAIARRFAGEGAAVVITGRSAELGEQVVKSIEADGGRAAFVSADVGVEADVAAAVGAARERFGPLTVLVNNAAPIRPPRTSTRCSRSACMGRSGAASTPSRR
jgi:NAD(P)-dependent dehydrogenase (short-subunit alcohol dehydrogenase family)